MKKLLIALALVIPSMAAVAAPAKAPICSACHGANGKAVIPGYPNLAGQNEQYLASSLKAYKANQRNGGLAVVMQAQAASLSDSDIAELAAYYAAMK